MPFSFKLHHKHAWVLIKAINTAVYENHKINEVPVSRGTRLLYRCSKCNKYKTDEIKGNFADEIIEENNQRARSREIGELGKKLNLK